MAFALQIQSALGQLALKPTCPSVVQSWRNSLGGICLDTRFEAFLPMLDRSERQGQQQ